MTDIIKRLRLVAEEDYRFASEAADEIERLRAELDALRGQKAVAVLFRTQSNQIEALYKGAMCPIDGNHFHKEFVDALPLAEAVPLFLAPQPAIPNRVVNAISVMVAQVMAQATGNSVNSISMPDECVEIAAWLARLPDDTEAPQPGAAK